MCMYVYLYVYIGVSAIDVYSDFLKIFYVLFMYLFILFFRYLREVMDLLASFFYCILYGAMGENPMPV